MTDKALVTMIREHEDTLTAAELKADEKTLRKLLADDFTGINFNGSRVNKEGFIKGLCNSGVKMESLKIENLEIKTTADSAVVLGKSSFVILAVDKKYSLSAEFLDVWRKTAEGWKLLAASVTQAR